MEPQGVSATGEQLPHTAITKWDLTRLMQILVLDHGDQTKRIISD